MSSAKNSVTAVQKVVYAEESLDFELCSKSVGHNIAADIYVSDPNTVRTLVSLSIGNESTVQNKLFLPEGTLALDNALDIVLIELNELKLVINNSSMDAKTRRDYKRISVTGFDVVDSGADTSTETYLTERDIWADVLDFDARIGVVIGCVIMIFLIIVFCWRFQNT